MPIFTYRAINEDNREIRGQIDGVDLDAARKALEDTHLDVVEIHEASRMINASIPQEASQPMALKTTFAFEGTDTTQAVRRGTIQADTKYQAFERLKHDQKLFVTMLSPLGVTPQYKDNDLENWQRKEVADKQQVAQPKPVVSTSVQSATSTPIPVQTKQKSVGFAIAESPKAQSEAHQAYHPLMSTLRLYAGWLLAWYGLFVALGYYAHVRSLPWVLPFVEAFFVSPLIFSFIVAIFLFLLLGGIHRAAQGHWMSRIVLGLLGIGAFVGVRMSIV